MARKMAVLLGVILVLGVLLAVPFAAQEAGSEVLSSGETSSVEVLQESSTQSLPEDSSVPDSSLPKEEDSSLSEEELPARARVATNLLAEIDVSAYLDAVGTGRNTLDLDKLKQDGIVAGTLVIEGTTATANFVKIVDSGDGSVAGQYNILIGENSGIELSVGLQDQGNTFYNITNKTGISTILPIYLMSSVDNVTLQNNGVAMNLKTTITFTGGNHYSTPVTYDKKLAVVASGAGVVVNTLSIADISVVGYNQSYVSNYTYPILFGAQSSATINNMNLNGNISVGYSNFQLGTMFGASDNGVIGTLTISKGLTIVGNGSGTYKYTALIGTRSAKMTNLIVASDAVILIDKANADNQVSSVVIGGANATTNSFTPNAAPIQNLVFENGSQVTIQNSAASSTGVVIGGEAKKIDIGGTVNMISINGSSTGAFIGHAYSRNVSDMLLIRSSANINISAAGYCTVAIGDYGNSSSKKLESLVVERGAKISVETTKPFSINDYNGADVVIGADASYGKIGQILVGAVYDETQGKYIVPDTVDPSNQTEIYSKNLTGFVSAGTLNGASVTINANMYAEMGGLSTETQNFYGAKYGKVILMGGNYIVKDVDTGEIRHAEFTNNVVGKYNTIRSTTYNQYGELLYSKLYIDDAEDNTFTYNVPNAGFTGATPEYNYIISRSVNPSVGAEYKALYYPLRSVEVRLSTPAAGELFNSDGVIRLEFDQPLYADKNVGNGQQIVLTQNGKTFIVNLSAEDSDKYTFGSDIAGDSPYNLYIDLSKLVSTSGTIIQDSGMVQVRAVASTFKAVYYEDDPQLVTERFSKNYSGSFNVRMPVYTVQFDLNGGTSAVIGQQEIVKGNYAARPQDPTRPNYTFLGWYTQASGGSEWSFDADAVTSNMVLYAHWQKMHTVTFHLNGGTSPVIAGQSVANGGHATRPQDPTWGGHVFVGWMTQNGGGVLWNFETNKVTSDIVLFAQWTTADASSGSSSVASSSSFPASSSQSTPASGTIEMNSNGAVETSSATTTVVPGGETGNGGNGGTVDVQLDAQTGNLLTDIANGNVPLANFAGGVWGLLNLILALVAAVMMMVLTITGFFKRRVWQEDGEGEYVREKTDKNRWSLPRLFALVCSLLPGILFLVLERMNQPVVLVNSNTPIIAFVFLVAVVLAVVQKVHGRKTADTENENDWDEGSYRYSPNHCD